MTSAIGQSASPNVRRVSRGPRRAAKVSSTRAGGSLECAASESLASVTSAPVLADERARHGFIGAWLHSTHICPPARAHRIAQRRTSRCARSGSTPTRRPRRCAVDELGGCWPSATFANDPAGHAALGSLGDGRSARTTGSASRARPSYGGRRGPDPRRGRLDVREVPPQLQPPRAAPDAAGGQERSGRRPRDRPGDRSAKPSCRRSGWSTRDASSACSWSRPARISWPRPTRIRNRLHADLVVLVPGYGGRLANLVAERHLHAAATSSCGAPGRPGRARPGPARASSAGWRPRSRELERRIAAPRGRPPARSAARRRCLDRGRADRRDRRHPALPLGRRLRDARRRCADPGELGPDPADAPQPGRQPPAQPRPLRRSPSPRAGLTRRPRRSSPASGPRARAGARPSGASSASSPGSSSGCSASRWSGFAGGGLTEIGACHAA